MPSWDDIQQLVRIVAYMASGWLVSIGQLDVANGETLGGALLALASVVWWWFWNRKAVKA
jgi:hypothetical protein